MTPETTGNRVIWEAESVDPELCEKLREGLKDVVDPEIGLNVIQLGLIRDLKIEPESAIVRMILTTPFCPYGPELLEVTRQKAEKVLGRPTSIDLSMDMWDFSMMEDGLGNDWGLY
ncbi:MAG TPA: iron-sulfur cluster assembly protein [Anaerolineaceae bacterium]|nr:iron-sulfur cluster assembly protein [Anaerolineaceae bacterium]